MDLMARATQEWNRGQGLFMPDWEVLLQWADVVISSACDIPHEGFHCFPSHLCLNRYCYVLMPCVEELMSVYRARVI